MKASILALVLWLVPVTPETGRFNILQDGQRIGTEEFTVSARGAGYVVEGTTQLTGGQPLTSRMELDTKLNVVSYEYRRGTGAIRIKVGQPTSEFITVADGRESSVDFRFPDGAFIVDNNFFHHYLLLLYRVGTAGSTLPVFVPQDMKMGQATIRPKGNGAYDLEMGDVRLEAATDSNGRLLRLTVPDAKVVIER